jgi:hypothetical protein
MTYVRYLTLIPYALFFLFVLAPVAVACYGLSAIARTAYTNVLAGWRDHK